MCGFAPWILRLVCGCGCCARRVCKGSVCLLYEKRQSAHSRTHTKLKKIHAHTHTHTPNTIHTQTPTQNMQVNTFFTAVMFFDAFDALRAALCSFSSFADSIVDLQKFIKHSLSTVPLKSPGALSTVYNGTYTSSRRSLQIRIQRFQKGDKMFNTVGQQVVHHSDLQDRSAHVLHPDVGDQAGSLPRTAITTGYGPTSFDLNTYTT